MGQGSVKGHGVWEETLPLPALKSDKAWLQILTRSTFLKATQMLLHRLSLSFHIQNSFHNFCFKRIAGHFALDVMSGCVYPPFNLPG